MPFRFNPCPVCCGLGCHLCTTHCAEIDVDLSGFVANGCAGCTDFNGLSVTAEYVTRGNLYCRWTHELSATICGVNYIHVWLVEHAIIWPTIYDYWYWGVSGTEDYVADIPIWGLYGPNMLTKPDCSALSGYVVANNDGLGAFEDCNYNNAQAELTAGICA